MRRQCLPLRKGTEDAVAMIALLCSSSSCANHVHAASTHQVNEKHAKSSKEQQTRNRVPKAGNSTKGRAFQNTGSSKKRTGMHPAPHTKIYPTF